MDTYLLYSLFIRLHCHAFKHRGQGTFVEHFPVTLNRKETCLLRTLKRRFLAYCARNNGTYPCERLQIDEDVAEHTEQDHLILEATPDLGQVNELRLKSECKKEIIQHEVKGIVLSFGAENRTVGCFVVFCMSSKCWSFDQCNGTFDS